MMIVTPGEVHDAIGENKACGLDNVTAEHLKLASQKLCPAIAVCVLQFFS